MARLLDQFRAGWKAPPGTWQRRRRRQCPDASHWEDVPPESSEWQADVGDTELAKRDAVIKELIGELEQCRGELAAARAEIAAGFSQALRDRFVRVARIMLHPDKYRTHPPVTDVGPFLEARLKEIEVEIDKIGADG
jgi:hypothetical protein